MEYAEIPGNDPVLILHGTRGGHDQGTAVARAVGLSHQRAVCPSRPGYLRTPLSTGEPVEQQADVMRELLDHLDIDRVSIIAFSGGGPCALEFTLRHPDRCRTLVTLCAVTQRTAPAKPTWSRLVQSALVKMDLATNAAARLASRSPGVLVPIAFRGRGDRNEVKGDPAKLSLLGELIAANALSSLRCAGRENDQLQEQDLRSIPFTDVSVPVLTFHGTDDENVPYDDAVALARQAPDSRLVTLDGADHFFLLPHREQVVEVIREHLAITR